MSLIPDGARLPDDTRPVAVDEAERCTRGADAPAVLLDVREQAERDPGHAPGAPFAPLSALTAGAPLPAAGHAVVDGHGRDGCLA